ncbi:hypothetical protein CL656_03655 [bacterium]|nr:hypothetical protein [bacterium]|tara:strand:+ start:9837 stop:10991 length:1155 start_codon:yes stop_codon:yes gene_type:complete
MSNLNFGQVASLLTNLEKGSISFGAGIPDPDTIPFSIIQEVSKSIFSDENLPMLSNYNGASGIPQAQNYFLGNFKDTKIKEPGCIITNGGQEGLDLCGKLISKNQNGVLVENPSYPGALFTFSIYGFPIHTFEVLPEFKIDNFKESILKSDAKFVYLIPNNHNPLGISYTRVQMDQISEVLSDSGIYIIEDDPYSKISFTERQTTLMHQVYGNTIYIGSTSKILTPSLRMGYVVSNQSTINNLSRLKMCANICTNPFTQLQVIGVFELEKFQHVLNDNIRKYKEKRDTMIKSIEKHLGENVSYEVPQGGLFLWLTLPKEIDSEELFKKSIQKKLGIFPGYLFFTGEDKPKNHIRLNFSNPKLENIDKGIKLLAALINELVPHKI